MSDRLLDDKRIERALRALIKAHGGDPDDLHLMERQDLEEAMRAKLSAAKSNCACKLGGIG